MSDKINLNYTSSDLTQEVNKFPNVFGLLNAMNLSPSEGKKSTLVRLDFREGQIFVLGAEPRSGGSAQTTDQDEHNGVYMSIPHFPLLSTISPSDLDNLLQVVDGQVTPESLEDELAVVLQKINAHHAITREYLRLCSLKGIIKDGRGKTIHNLYSLFDITKKVISLGLNDENTDVLAKFEEVNDHIGNILIGDSSGGTEHLVSGEMMNKLIAHPKVEKYWGEAIKKDLSDLKRDYRGKNYGRVFEFGSTIVREYKGKLPFKAANGSVTMVDNVEAGKGHAYPSNTQNLFRTFDGPAFHIAEVNKRPETDENDQAIFVSAKELDHGEGIELKSQTNTLAVCKQPQALVELTL